MMSLFALADLHLSFGSNKPMDVFGETWHNHATRIRDAWKDCVSANDYVLIPGDISWAMREQEVVPDMQFLQELPGKKILLKGNHDYWWSTKRKVEILAGPLCSILQNNAIELEDFTLVGTRGWSLPDTTNFSSEDEAIYVREISRLRLSLEQGYPLGKPMLAMMHYPPTSHRGEQTAFTDLLEQFGVTHCIYGHLHGTAHKYRVQGFIRNVNYQLVASDYLNFTPFPMSTWIQA